MAAMADKPVVGFDRIVGWGEHPYSGELNATLAGVKGHPSLGNESIACTSRIERIAYGDDGAPVEIETRNTIYRVAR
jgi:hypothetical protein